jgi:hypothetical protein
MEIHSRCPVTWYNLLHTTRLTKHNSPTHAGKLHKQMLSSESGAFLFLGRCFMLLSLPPQRWKRCFSNFIPQTFFIFFGKSQRSFAIANYLLCQHFCLGPVYPYKRKCLTADQNFQSKPGTTNTVVINKYTSINRCWVAVKMTSKLVHKHIVWLLILENDRLSSGPSKNIGNFIGKILKMYRNI